MIERLGAAGSMGTPSISPTVPWVALAEGERSFKEILKDSIQNVNRL